MIQLRTAATRGWGTSVRAVMCPFLHITYGGTAYPVRSKAVARICGEVWVCGRYPQAIPGMTAVCGTAPPTFERSWVPTSVPASAAPLAASWRSAWCTCGFWRKPPCRRCTMSVPRPVSALLCRRARPSVCRESIDFRTVTLSVEGQVFCGDRWETRCHDGSGRRCGLGRPAEVAVGCGAVVRRCAAGLRRAGRPGAEGAKNALLLGGGPTSEPDRTLRRFW
jgi:hypothetical protein